MITMLRYRHYGRDCLNPGSMDGLEPAIQRAGSHFPADMTSLRIICQIEPDRTIKKISVEATDKKG